jgi:hypothetical protein
MSGWQVRQAVRVRADSSASIRRLSRGTCDDDFADSIYSYHIDMNSGVHATSSTYPLPHQFHILISFDNAWTLP